MLVKKANEYVPKHPLSPIIFLWVCIFIMLYKRTVSKKPQHFTRFRFNVTKVMFTRE